MHVGRRRPDALTLLAFLLAVSLGGANFLGVRFSNRELPPFWGAGLRFSLAAGLFIGLALVLRLRWPKGRQLVLTMVYGALGFAFSYALAYWALVRVTAGVATIVLAVVPLVTLLLAAAQGLERLQPRGLVGALLAVLGIAWMSLGPDPLHVPAGAVLALLVGSLCIGQSIIVSKRVAANHPVVINAVGMTTGAALLLAISAAAGESWALPRQPEALGALVYLATVGSVGLFILVLLVVRRWAASATSYMFVLFPVVAMGLGALLGDEALSLQALSGAALVMAGVWFGAFTTPSAVITAPPPILGKG